MNLFRRNSCLLIYTSWFGLLVSAAGLVLGVVWLLPFAALHVIRWLTLPSPNYREPRDRGYRSRIATVLCLALVLSLARVFDVIGLNEALDGVALVAWEERLSPWMLVTVALFFIRLFYVDICYFRAVPPSDVEAFYQIKLEDPIANPDLIGGDAPSGDAPPAA